MRDSKVKNKNRALRPGGSPSAKLKCGGMRWRRYGRRVIFIFTARQSLGGLRIGHPRGSNLRAGSLSNNSSAFLKWRPDACGAVPSPVHHAGLLLAWHVRAY